MPPRGWRKPSKPMPDPLPVVDPYLEHAKMHPHMETNGAIREFWEFLYSRGLTELSYGQWEDALLEFRGVDKLAYLAESARMRSEYRWLWEKFMPVELEPVEPRPVITEKVEKVGSGGNGALSDLLARIRGGKSNVDQD
jgi:hypothetical protein